MTNLSDFKGDSVSLALLDKTQFTITSIEKSVYHDAKDGDKDSVKIVTAEEFTLDEKPQTKFHTTRQAVVKKLTEDAIMESVNEKKEPLGPVTCLYKKSTTSSMHYYALIDASSEEAQEKFAKLEKEAKT